MRAARSAGGMPLRSGFPERSVPGLGREEAAEIAERCSDRLKVKKSVRLRHFSHFDSKVRAMRAPEPTAATAELVTLLGDIQRSGWRGVRPQIARAILIFAQMAHRDGYSLRVAGETALLNQP